jgi:pimeloyl-ACP methyl ester carboxylesterase
MRFTFASLIPYAIVIGAVFFGLCAFLYFRQDAFLFFPGPNDPTLRKQLRGQRVEIPSDGIVIEAWWTTNPSASTSAVIIYFGGNAEDVLYLASTADQLPARHLLVANYRGFGGTGGRLSERAAFRDALALHDYAVKQEGIAADRIVVMGRSLGSGVATWLATQRPVAGSILVTPYDSFVAVGRRHYPILPVGWLLKHRFESDKRASEIRSPVLMIAAEQDFVIPPSHAQRLFESWSGPKELHVLPGVGHNDVELHPDYDALVSAFLMKVAPARVALEEQEQE